MVKSESRCVAKKVPKGASIELTKRSVGGEATANQTLGRGGRMADNGPQRA